MKTCSTVFVGGYLRTGTTLMQGLLCGRPETHRMIREVLHLRGLIESFSRSLRFFDEHSVDYFDDRTDLAKFSAEQVGAFLDRTRARLGSPECLVLKHPQLTPYFPLLSTLVPRARFIVMVRDPLDSVASAFQARERGATEFGTMSAAAIGAAQEGYVDAALASQSRRYVGRVLPVRYEDLVRQPAEVLAAVETFLGLSPQATEVDSSGVDFEAEHQTARPLHSPLYGKRPTSERVGGHVHVLSPADIDAVRAATPMMRRRFGYS